MNFVPKMNRRSFVVGTAAVGGGSRSASTSRRPEVVRAADGSPEVGVWVVIRPDDTVVIRIAAPRWARARSPASPSSSPKNSNATGRRSRSNIRRPAKASPASAPGATSRPAAAAASASRTSMCAKGGAAARMMLIQAAANEWKVPASECSASNSTITHKASNRTTTYGKVAEAAAKLEVPKDVKLKDPKDWKIAGKPLKRLDTADKVTGKTQYGTDFKLPGCSTPRSRSARCSAAR